MLTDYVEEFLRRKYNISEIRERIPKFSIYYKNYLNFFCKPTYNCFKFNKIIQNYGEKKAEIYYKQNYQGGVTNDEENNGMEESSSDESSNKENEYEFNDDGKIFNNMVKEKLDNVTVMTTISNTGNNTINLNINNEKIEVFSENKAEISNDTTIGDIIDDIKKEMKKINKKKKTKKKFKYSHRNYMNYSLKIQDSYKEGRPNKNLSIENRKKINPKDISKKILLNKSNKDKSKIKFSNGKLISKNIKSQISKYNIMTMIYRVHSLYRFTNLLSTKNFLIANQQNPSEYITMEPLSQLNFNFFHKGKNLPLLFSVYNGDFNYGKFSTPFRLLQIGTYTFKVGEYLFNLDIKISSAKGIVDVFITETNFNNAKIIVDNLTNCSFNFYQKNYESFNQIISANKKEILNI